MSAEAAADPVSENIFHLVQTFLRNVSFDAPRIADYPMNTGKEDMDKVDFNVSSRAWRFREDRYALEVHFDVHATRDDETVFRVSLVELGTFRIVGYTEDEAAQLLQTKGVDAVYPFAREIIHSLASRCGIQRLGLPAVALRSEMEQPGPAFVEPSFS